MRKAYSKRAGAEVYALAPEQIEEFRKAGYKTPTPEEAIADAGAVKLEPPEGSRAYVVFDFKAGEFAVRVRTCTLKGSDYSSLCGEIIKAAILKRLAENADPDRPKAPPAAGTSSAAGASSAIVELLKAALTKTIIGAGATASPAAQTPTVTPAPPEGDDGEEVST